MQKEKPKAYIVKMSGKGSDVKIEPEEVEKVINAIKVGGIAIVKQGIINPSFFVGIVEDHERIKNYLDEVNAIVANNKNYDSYRIGKKEDIPEFTQLADIFKGISLPAGKKQLN